MNAVRGLVAGAALAIWATPVPLAAQTIPLMPTTLAPAQTYVASPTRPDLTLQGSVSGGYDVNGTSESSSISLSPLFRRRGKHLGGDLQLQFSAPGRRVGFGASGGSSFRYYPAADNILVTHSAAVGVSIGLSPHMTLTGGLFGGYSPPYQFNMYPTVDENGLGQVAPVLLDAALSLRSVVSYGANTTLSYKPTKRSSFEFDGAFRDVATGNRTFGGRTEGASALYHLNLFKGLGARLGYRYQRSLYTDPATGSTVPFRGDNLDIGLDYMAGRGLTISRYTTATFGFGAGAFNTDRVTRYRLVGRANLQQQLRRNWRASVGYNRGLNFVDGFAVPIFSDSLNARVVGLLTQRLSASGTFAYSFGGLDDLSSSGRYRSRRTIVELRGALTRQLDSFVQYVNYHHTFPDAALLLAGAPLRLNRQGVRAGVTFVMPLLPGRRVARRAPL